MRHQEVPTGTSHSVYSSPPLYGPWLAPSQLSQRPHFGQAARKRQYWPPKLVNYETSSLPGHLRIGDDRKSDNKPGRLGGILPTLKLQDQASHDHKQLLEPTWTEQEPVFRSAGALPEQTMAHALATKCFCKFLVNHKAVLKA